ncbi:tail protein X [Lysobacter sp. CA199]|uniref:tail protein X n=1 Tax=Lysobacter sp. CA199 TaxID=3455608 RepID=UPI003F8D2BBF
MRAYAAQGETLDALCWRVLGRTAGVVEAAIAANPGLADLGPVLPHGTPVDLPDPVARTPQTRPLIQLWD